MMGSNFVAAVLCTIQKKNLHRLVLSKTSSQDDYLFLGGIATKSKFLRPKPLTNQKPANPINSRPFLTDVVHKLVQICFANITLSETIVLNEVFRLLDFVDNLVRTSTLILGTDKLLTVICKKGLQIHREEFAFFPVRFSNAPKAFKFVALRAQCCV